MQENLLRFQKDKIFLFCDTETECLTLTSEVNRAWQIATVRVKGDNIVDEKDLYPYYDDLNVTPQAAAINHFEYGHYKRNSKPPKQVYEELLPEFTNADYILFHNGLGFDVYMLNNLFKLFGDSFYPFLNKIIDTNFLAKGKKLGILYKPGENLLEYMYKIQSVFAKGIKTKQAVLAQEYKIEFDEKLLHNALYDLRLCAKIWNKLKWEIEI